MKNRTRIDIYAAIIDAADSHQEGLRITRISYAAGIPTDRARKFVEQLMSAGLLAPSVKDNAYYVCTKHGQRFLQSYYIITGYLDEIDAEKDWI